MFKLLNRYRNRPRTLGFTLVELAIVLGVTGVLFAGLWRLLSGGNQQLRDQAAANTQQQLISAVSSYLATPEGAAYMAKIDGTSLTPNKDFPLPDAVWSSVAICKTNTKLLAGEGVGNGYPTHAGLCDYLPLGFYSGTTNPYGQAFSIRIMKDSTGAGTAPRTYSFMIMTVGGDVASDTSGGRISAMIGGDGGFIYGSNVCNAAFQTYACGSYGSWAVDVIADGGYNFSDPAPADAYEGHVVSRTNYSPLIGTDNPWLARIFMTGDNSTQPVFNTMTTQLLAGRKSIYLGDNITASAGGNNVDYIAGDNTTGGALNLQGGTLNMNRQNNDWNGGAGAAVTTGGKALNMQGANLYMATLKQTDVGAPEIVQDAASAASINLQGADINLQSDTNTATTTTGAINMMGGTMNLQGGKVFFSNVAHGGTGWLSDINAKGNIPLNLVVGAGAPGYLSTTAGDNAFVNLSTGCSVDSGAPLTFHADCQSAININGDSYVVGQENVNSLYSRTFVYKGSDVRLKTNIVGINNALSGVMKLRPVSYTLKASGKDGLGVIAQELEKVYPQLVGTGPDGMKAVEYEGLIAPLIGAVQELSHENQALREQIRAQSERMSQIEAALKKK